MARFALDGRRYDTDRMNCLWGGRHEMGPGTAITGVYVMPRARRVFVETDSRWDRGDGVCVGTRYHEADAEEIGQLANRLGCDELLDLLPAVE